MARDIELVEGDIQSYERVHRAVRGCETVLHQAALPSVPRSIEDPLASNASNVTGTLNVLSAARDNEVARVVYASSSSVYGLNHVMPKHEDLPVAPFSPYAVAKHAGEGYCRSFHQVYGLETVSLRYFNVFGSRQDPLSQYAAVIPNFIAAVLAGRRPIVYGDGEQSRDFTHVDNVVEANMLAITAEGVGGALYNVATGKRTSINRVIEVLRTATGREVVPEYAPVRAGEVKHSQADIGRAQRELGYRPGVTFGEGLTRTLEYYAQGAPTAVG